MTSFGVGFACEVLGETVVLSAEGREVMDGLSSFSLLVQVAVEVQLDALLLAPALLVFSDGEEDSTRAISLLVMEASLRPSVGRDRVIALRLSDPLATLTLRSGYAVFLEKTAEEIVKEVLLGAGVPPESILSRLSGSYPRYPQRCQYGETEWDFIRRLLADEGISCWTETLEDGSFRFVLADDKASYDGIDGDPRLALMVQGTARPPGRRALLSLEWEASLAHDHVFVRDFDVDHPDVYVDGEAGKGQLGWLEWPAMVPDKRAAEARAKRRLEQLRRDEARVTGTSDCIRLRPGRVVDVKSAFDELFEQRMLVSEVKTHYTRPLRDGGIAAPWICDVVLRPTRDDAGEELPTFRPALEKTPRVPHLESAVVTGPAGEEIHTEALGRVKIRFLWDRSGIEDDRSSAWVRTLQWPLGGAMMLPRVGWEVAVGYLDGFVDRPFVLGRVYNATAVYPYSLPAGRGFTALQTWTSPGNGETQGFRLGDDAGSEAFSLHAARDLSVNVGGNRDIVVDGKETRSIGLGLLSSIGASESVTIAGSQSIDVGEPIQIVVDGANTEVMALESISVTGNRVVHASGGYEEIVGGAYVLQCNQSNTKTMGAYTRTVGGSASISTALGFTESVAGARTYSVGGSRTLTCASTYAESIKGGKRSAAGAVEESAAVDWGVSAPTGKLTSGTAEFGAGGSFVVEAAALTIDVSGSINAGSLAISGGALHAKSGTTVLNGMVKRDQGGKAGR